MLPERHANRVPVHWTTPPAPFWPRPRPSQPAVTSLRQPIFTVNREFHFSSSQFALRARGSAHQRTVRSRSYAAESSGGSSSKNGSPEFSSPLSPQPRTAISTAPPSSLHCLAPVRPTGPWARNSRPDPPRPTPWTSGTLRSSCRFIFAPTPGHATNTALSSPHWAFHRRISPPACPGGPPCLI